MRAIRLRTVLIGLCWACCFVGVLSSEGVDVGIPEASERTESCSAHPFYGDEGTRNYGLSDANEFCVKQEDGEVELDRFEDFEMDDDEDLESCSNLEYDSVVADEDYSGFDNLCEVDKSKAHAVSVDEFGAKGDGLSDDTKAFELAWKRVCTTFGTYLKVPKGKSYQVRPITFSGTCHAPVRVQIKGKIVAPADPYAWKGQNTRQWLVFKTVTDLTVEGGGTIDGRGKAWWEKSCKVKKSNPCTSAPTAVTFESINNLRVKNIKVQNAQQMHMSFQKCVGVQASYIKISAPGTSPNTDGIHVTGSKYVSIKHATIGTGDDCISIVSGCVNVKARDIRCGPGHGISIGSLGEGNSEAEVSNVLVDKAYLSDTTNGVRIKTWQGGSGYARGITFKNIRMNNVSNPIIIDQYYCDSPRKCPKQESAVKVSKVAYKNIKGTTPTKEAIKFECSETVSCEALFLQNIRLQLQPGKGFAISKCINAKGSAKGTVIPPPCFS